jgi:serine/threonine protein kinase
MSVTLINNLGTGNFGKVYKAKKENGDIFAVKIIEPKELRYIELDILSRLRSPYLIKSFQDPVIDTNLGKGITMDLKESSLNNLNTEKLSYHQMKRIIISSLYGLKCMHDNNYLHLDIKLANIMYDVDKGGDFTAFIGDFGYAARCTDARQGITTKHRAFSVFMAPENLAEMKEGEFHFNDRTDVWSLGMVFLFLLGARIKLVNAENLLKDLEAVNEEYIEEKIRVYNKNKMSPQEELELKELLVHMLKPTNKERMSTSDLEKMAIFKNTRLRDSCLLEKPKEIYYLPYISPQVKDGIQKIEDVYKENPKLQNFDRALPEYFLALQIFIRMMVRSKPDLDEEELMHMVRVSLSTAQNYYRNVNSGNFEIAEKLDSEVGYNPFFYKAHSIDDLVILNYYIKDNDNLIAFYNLIEPTELFDIFRSMYEYTNVSKNKMSIEDFFKLTVPKKKEEMEVTVFSPDEYHNSLSKFGENENNINTIKRIEKDFREKILDDIKEHIENVNTQDERIDIVYNLLQGNINSNIYHNLKNVLGDINISEVFTKLVDYGYIKLDTEEIVKEYETEKEYVIIVEGNRSSLLHIHDKKVTHYYSDRIDKIAKFYQEKGYEYENNFDYGIGNCCVLREACIIFNIFYNQTEKVLDFSTKCLERNTFFLIIVFLISH